MIGPEIDTSGLVKDKRRSPELLEKRYVVRTGGTVRRNVRETTLLSLFHTHHPVEIFRKRFERLLPVLEKVNASRGTVKHAPVDSTDCETVTNDMVRVNVPTWICLSFMDSRSNCFFPTRPPHRKKEKVLLFCVWWTSCDDVIRNAINEVRRVLQSHPFLESSLVERVFAQRTVSSCTSKRYHTKCVASMKNHFAPLAHTYYTQS